MGSEMCIRDSANDLDGARKTFDMLWAQLVSAEQPGLPSGSGSAEQPALPNVAALLDSISIESLDWLLENFLWGEVSRYVLSNNGTLAYNPSGEQVSADVKLELLIKLTRERRERFCALPSMDILTEEELNDIITVWKHDYQQWMHPETIQYAYSLTNQQWHQLLRRSFRTFLFHLVGSYEMSVFFLVAPFNPDTLDIFQRAWEQSATHAEVLVLAKRLLRDSLAGP